VSLEAVNHATERSAVPGSSSAPMAHDLGKDEVLLANANV